MLPQKPRLSTFLAKPLAACLNLGLCLSAPTMFLLPASAAERIYVDYGPLELSLPVEALEKYATTGKIEEELATFAERLNEQQRKSFQKLLVTPANVSPVAVSQFLYSPQGEIILERMGKLIKTKAGQPGFYAIRAALIQAAADEQGLTLLNVLKEFPSSGIRINSKRGFEIIEELSNLIEQTEQASAAVEEHSRADRSATTSLDFSELPNLRQPGSISFSKQTLTFNDSKRERTFPVDLYLPQQQGRQAPVVVISHGLGSERKTFEYLATHLASYGFAVALVEHPGSNEQQLRSLLAGLRRQVSPPRELIDRPLDLKYLLDKLQRSYSERLNLQQVGVIGQSYGGYTVLALAGAELNFEQLQQDCQSLDEALNLSLLLQCQALKLPHTQHNLQDERVKAGIAINPLTSAIFGEEQLSQIQVPLMLVAGSADTAAPALSEQIRPFTWLTTEEKYLALLKGGTHFSALTPSTEDSVEIPEQAIGPDPAIAHNYIQALSTAFLETYVANEFKYKAYLSADYAQSISQPPMPLLLIESLKQSQLQQ
ncbi:MAG: hypothetical protein BRC55_11630 [Cyanobacteria bacterium SW_8_48_13]|nr:MAG: hypothetical protein BRC55_11630 [Cyanobacteria bacterium SW_8_48_13]